MSNTERQRRFRKRNPGYYGRLHRKRKAALLQYCAEQEAREAWVKANLFPDMPLMLPAPEQVGCPAADALMQQIRDAVAARNEGRAPTGHGREGTSHPPATSVESAEAAGAKDARRRSAPAY